MWMQPFLRTTQPLTIIARDAHGFVLKAWSKILPKKSPLSAETEAILWALQLAKSEAWSEIILESDSKNSIDAIMDCTSCPPWFPWFQILVSLLSRLVLVCFFELVEFVTLLPMR